MDGQQCILLNHFWGPFNSSSGYGPLHKQCGGPGRRTPESALLLFFPGVCSCVILGVMHCFHLNWLTFQRGRKMPQHKAAGKGEQDSESTWPRARPLGGTLTCWFKTYSGRQGRVRVSQYNRDLVCPLPLWTRTKHSEEKTSNSRRLKTELQ